MNTNDANDEIEQAAAGVNEATSLSSSQPTATAAEDAESDDITSADEETSEVVFFYDSEDQVIPKNVTKLITGKNITHIKREACAGCDRSIERG